MKMGAAGPWRGAVELFSDKAARSRGMPEQQFSSAARHDQAAGQGIKRRVFRFIMNVLIQYTVISVFLILFIITLVNTLHAHVHAHVACVNTLH